MHTVTIANSNEQICHNRNALVQAKAWFQKFSSVYAVHHLVPHFLMHKQLSACLCHNFANPGNHSAGDMTIDVTEAHSLLAGCMRTKNPLVDLKRMVDPS